MKLNVLRIFLLYLYMPIIVGAESIAGESPQNIDNSQIQPKDLPSNSATKGAIIEAIFILQNKKNSLLRQVRRAKIAMSEVEHLIQDLLHEKQMLFDHFYTNNMQSKTAHSIDTILVDLSVFYREILNINLVKSIYPDYLNQLERFVQDVNHVIECLVTGSTTATFDHLKHEIDRFDNILDILEKEERLIALVLDIENIKLSCKKLKDRLESRQKHVELYEQHIKSKDDSNYTEQYDLMNGSIKRLKKKRSKLIRDLENKQEKMNGLRYALIKHYEEHKRYVADSLFSNCTQDNRMIKNDSLIWFINAIEDIRKKLNKKFNLDDLV